MKIKNIFCTSVLFLFCALLQSQTVWYDIKESNKEDVVEQKSTTSGEEPEFAANESTTTAIDGLSTGTINQANGKVNYSVPITSITSNRLTAGLDLSFNGSNAIKYVDYSNKMKATGVVGLGWNINTSKIIADNKQTGYRDDDEFFLLEGGLKKLICTKKTSANFYEFKVENLPNWKVFYYRSSNYWVITKDNGNTYFYGNSDTNVTTNANENIIRWKNWIGDSRATGGTLQTFAWNLSKISNQWNDKIEFFYETTNQAVQADNLGPKHTEASYLVRIESNSGEAIELNYLDKTNTNSIQEYYEPHTEINEPDAYQEQYEKKYLDNIVLKRSDGQQLSKHQLEYEIYGSGLLAKRYLTQITLNNSNNEPLNPQRFEYNTDGVFKGTIHKIKNTTGSEVTYQYENKFLDNNDPSTIPYSYTYNDSRGVFLKDNFIVRKNNHSTAGVHFLVNTWDGEKWREKKLFYFQESSVGPITFVEDDYMGYYFQNKCTIFYLDDDGYTWREETFDVPIIATEISQVITTDKYVVFVAKDGKMIPIVKSGKQWGKANSFNEGRDYDDVTISKIKGKHMLFDGKAFSYQMDHSFRTETYDLPSVTNCNFFPEDPYCVDYPNYPRNIPLSDITLTEYEFSNDLIFNNMIKGLDDRRKKYFFNGKDWIGPYHLDNRRYGINKLFGSQTVQSDNTLLKSVIFFDPNFNSFSEYNIQEHRYQPYEIGEYLIYENSIYKSNSNSMELIEEYDTNVLNEIGLYYQYDFQLGSSGNDKLFIRKRGGHDEKFRYFYINPKNGEINRDELQISEYPASTKLSNSYYITKKSSNGNYNGALTTSIQRFQDNMINQDIYDIVIKSINVSDGFNQNNITDYTFNEPRTLANDATYYGEVITEKRGNGNSSIGKVFNYFNTGDLDIRKAGLLEKTIIKNIDGNIVKQTVNSTVISPDLFENNSENRPVFIGNRLLQNKKTTQTYFYENSQPNVITSIEEYEYNEKGLINKSKRTNSKGLIEEQNIEYAYENSNAFENVNMINAVSKRISKIDNKITGVTIAEWGNELGRLYPKKEFSGPNENDIRLTSEITKISNKGVVEETTNGKGLYAVNLSGHNYKRSVASIDNARFSEVIENLDVSYSQLQNLNHTQLKTELIKLYNRLPNAMIKLSFYDDNGNITSEIDARQEEIKYHYDNFNRLDYITDSNDNVLKKNIYNYKPE